MKKPQLYKPKTDFHVDKLGIIGFVLGGVIGFFICAFILIYFISSLYNSNHSMWLLLPEIIVLVPIMGFVLIFAFGIPFLLLGGLFSIPGDFKNRTGITSKDRDRGALFEFLDTKNKFFLLLRPFDLDMSISILPYNYEANEFDNSLIPAGEYERQWNLVFARKNIVPNELFEVIANSTPKKMKLVGLGKRKMFQYGGAALISSTDKTWRDDILTIFSRVDIIFLVPWSTVGTMWEIDKIIQKRKIGKTIFIMPPCYDVMKKSEFVKKGFHFDTERTVYHKIDGRNSELDYDLDLIVSEHPTIPQRLTAPFPGNRQMILQAEFEERFQFMERIFTKSCQPLEQAGYKVPEYISDGMLFFYKRKKLWQSPIPYHKRQMKMFLDLRNEKVMPKNARKQ